MKATAIRMVQNGLLARIGAAIDIGRCFSANVARIQELPAITDFANNSPWSNQLMGSTTSPSNGTQSRATCDRIKSGDQSRAEVRTLKNSTGGTALSRTAAFFAIS